MFQKQINTFFAIAFSLISVFSYSQHEDHSGHNHEKDAHNNVHTENATPEKHLESKFDAVKMIMHHISDANEFHIIGNEKTSLNLTMPLPIIVYSKESGLKMFMSSKFHHGKTAVDGYVLNHGIVNKIKENFPTGEVAIENNHGHITFKGKHFETETKATLAHSSSFYDFSITKNVFSLFMSVFILLLVFMGMGSFYKKGNLIPKGFYAWLEPVILFVKNDIAIDNIGEKKAEKFLPLLLSVFFFILINNLIGLIPMFPFSANVTGNIAFTFVLAFIVLIIVNVNGNKDYWGHILWMPGIPTPMKFIMALIELIGILTKPFALMMRLFANITAGHILILSLVSLIFIFNSMGMSAVSIPFLIFMNFLELLVAFLQAYIFTLLTALFIGTAVAEHEHH